MQRNGIFKRTAALPLCLLLLLLSGCGRMLETEYRFEEVYTEEYTAQRSDPSVQEVRNYAGMKSALMNLLNTASEYGIIRTTKYNGAVEDDISKACFEVTRETPLGLYAVEYMSHSVTRILSYYEISVSISYKHTAEEIAAIRTVHTERELGEQLSETLTSLEDGLTFMQVSTEFGEEEVRAVVGQTYRNDPLHIPVEPSVSVNIYASASGVQRITEVGLDYGQSEAELHRRASSLTLWCDTYFKDRAPDDALSLARAAISLLQPIGTQRTAYDALIGGGTANEEGFAMVMKLLCQYRGVNCYVVSGLRDERSHYWNIVEWEGNCYHLDAYSAAMRGEEPALLSDAQMLGTYRWDTSKYPPCDTEIPAVPEEDEEEKMNTFEPQ